MKIIDAICVTSQDIQRRKIAFENGIIIDTDAKAQADYTFGDDCLLFAGMGDIHIHAREDVSQKNTYKEDFLSAQAAMHNGGVTHAGDMPNNPIPPIDDESYEAKLRLAGKTHGELWIYAGIGPDTNPLSYKVPYKAYMGPSIGELFFQDLKTLDQAISRYQGQWVSFHCEDPEILDSHKSESHHHLRRPEVAEVMATRDAINLIEKYKLHGKLCHYSTGDGLKLIREARARGVQIDIEVTPQHLYFDIDLIQEDDRTLYQMNPPIRRKADRLAMMEAFKNGEINYLATDHAPHTVEEKKKGTSGLTGLDSFGPFVTWLLSEGIDPKLISKVACENPGEFHNQFLETWKKISPAFKDHGLGVGFLKTGYRANFTVLNLKKPFKLTREKLKTKVAHSPFLDITFPGQVEALFIGGQKV